MQQAITWVKFAQIQCRDKVSLGHNELTHLDWVTHICISTTYQIASDSGLSHVRQQAIIWTNATIL